jgi:hypothetical protein
MYNISFISIAATVESWGRVPRWRQRPIGKHRPSAQRSGRVRARQSERGSLSLKAAACRLCRARLYRHIHKRTSELAEMPSSSSGVECRPRCRLSRLFRISFASALRAPVSRFAQHRVFPHPQHPITAHSGRDVNGPFNPTTDRRSDSRRVSGTASASPSGAVPPRSARAQPTARGTAPTARPAAPTGRQQAAVRQVR